jgi:hypothetical protein
MPETDLRKWNRLMGFNKRSEFYKDTNVDMCLFCVHFREFKVESMQHPDGYHYRRCALSNQRINEQDICNKYREEKGPVTILE